MAASPSQTYLGEFHESAARVAEVIAHLPILPMTESHIPHTLDQTARILQVAGQSERAAVALGKALAVPMPGDTIFARDAHKDEVSAALERSLGRERVATLMADGAALDTDDALATFKGWLMELAEEVS